MKSVFLAMILGLATTATSYPQRFPMTENIGGPWQPQMQQLEEQDAPWPPMEPLQEQQLDLQVCTIPESGLAVVKQSLVLQNVSNYKIAQ